MAFAINYNVDCPQCKVAGIDRKLGLDRDTGKIACDAETPHTYEQLPDAPSEVPEAAGAMPEPLSEDPVTEEKNQQAEQKRFSEVVGKRAIPLRPEPENSASLTPAQTERLDKILAGGLNPPSEPIAAPVSETDAKALGRPRIAPPDVVYVEGRVGIGEIQELDGGDLLFGLKVSEQWVQAIRAQAESQNQALGEYLQDFINNVALLNEWESAQAPK